jgi:hypothetical protein
MIIEPRMGGFAERRFDRSTATIVAQAHPAELPLKGVFNEADTAAI